MAAAAPGAAAVRGRGYRRGAVHTVTVHLAAPVTVNMVILAVVLAVAGGLIAGISAAGAPPGCARRPRWPGSNDRAAGASAGPR